LVGGTPVTNNLTTNSFLLTNTVQSLDGPAALALFAQPAAVVVDSGANVFIADRANNSIRKLTPSGVVSTVAGSPLLNGSLDGMGTNALFNHPTGIAQDSAGNLYVADTDNSTIRKLTPSGGNWVVSTIAGLARFHGTRDGTNSSARFDSPRRMVADSATNLYVSDGVDNTIRKLTPVGTNWVVTTVGGQAGTYGSTDGAGTNALFYEPESLAVDTAGNLYVADAQNNTLRLGQRVQIALPLLRITPSAGQVMLSWPATATGFTLETSSKLLPAPAWVPLTNGTLISGTNYVLTNLGAANAFYRLHGH
jgi:hypothetical protein